jgi:hypothetical protein
MKKLTLLLLITACMLLLLVPAQLKAGDNANTKTVSTSATTTAKSAEYNALVVRSNEIKAMDKSVLSSSEKKELRKETRSIKSELKVKGESTWVEGSNGGIYISVGGVLIIILLLVLLL